MSDLGVRSSPASGEEPAREPYAKPAIVFEEPLAVRADIAMACVKMSGQSVECDGASAS
jgi:hypothetical protein